MTKRKPKNKPTAQQRQLAAEWEAMCARHAKPLERGALAKGVKRKTEPEVVSYDTRVAALLQAPRISMSDFAKVQGSTRPKDAKKYTGEGVKHMCTMHKSNIVPAFSDEAAIDIARMRR